MILRKLKNRFIPSLLISLASANTVYAGTDDLLPGESFPQVFSDQSPWNTSIKSNPVIDPMSEDMIFNLKWTLDYLSIPTSIGISYNAWTSPIHIIDFESAPKIDIFNPTGSPFYYTVDPDGDGIARDIPLPAGIWADPQVDGHMILVDINKKQAYEFSRIQQGIDIITASRVDFWDLNEIGARTVAGPDLGVNYWMSGVRGAGTPFIAGIVRYDEMKAGLITHALAFSGITNRKRNVSSGHGLAREFCGYSPLSSGQVGVASRSDGFWVDEGPVVDGHVSPEDDQWREGASILEGQRIMLSPTLDIEALLVSDDAKVILRALQTYGGYMVDNAIGFNIYFENLGTEASKWNEFAGVLDIAQLPLESLDILTCDNPVYYNES